MSEIAPVPPSIPAMFARAVARYPDDPVLASKVDGRYQPITYRELARMIDGLSAHLIASGVGMGDRIAILSENRPEWIIADQAIQGAGAITVPLYTTLTSEQCRYILDDCGARVLVLSSRSQLDKIEAVRGQLTALEQVIIMDADPRALSLEEALQRGERHMSELAPELRRRQEALGSDDLASIVYTSGTTGEPKGAMLSHGNFATNALTAGSILSLGHGDRALSFLPLSHVFERIACIYCLGHGVTVYYAESLDTIAANLLEVRPNFFPAVPRVLEKLQTRITTAVESGPALKRELFWTALELAKHVEALRDRGEGIPLPLSWMHAGLDRLVFSPVRQRLGGELRYVFSGGAPLSREVAEFYRAMGICVVEGYGLTETSPVVTLNPPERQRLGTVGLVIPGVEVRLADDGEILVKGPNIMKGYWNKPDATAECLSEDGWFATGDVGRLDDDGYLSIVDRKKELLVMSNGKNVAPQPIENALKASSLVEQAMLVGDDRKFIGALIVPAFDALEREARSRDLGDLPVGDQLAHPEIRALYQEVVNQVNAELAPYEQIKAFVLLGEEFSEASGELTPSLKPKRRVILAKHAGAVEALYRASRQPVGV